jgi:DNA-binding NtrC family response regulator
MASDFASPRLTARPLSVEEIGAALTACNLADVPLGVLEHAAIIVALERHDGCRTRAARSLGISVRTLQRKLKMWGIE